MRSDRRESTLERTRVLFLCSGNSARSQMAEALLRSMAGERFEARSAGMRAKGIHPLTHRVLNEIGVDTSDLTSKPVREFMGKLSIQVAIILCEKARQECPSIYPFARRTLYWPFDDPADEALPADRQLDRFRDVRDAIRTRLQEWIEVGSSGPAPVNG